MISLFSSSNLLFLLKILYRNMRKILFFLLLSLFLLSSCVSKKKYLLEFDTRRAAEQRESVLREEIAAERTRVSDLTSQLTDVSRTNGTLEYVNNNLRNENQELKSRLSDINTSSSSQIQQLNQRLSETTEKLTQREQTLQTLQTTVAERNQILADFYTRLDTTMRFFATDGVTTEFSEGKAIVRLPGDLLFGTGSARLSRAGQETLARLGVVLANNPSMDIAVEGHTDNTTPRSRSYPDNWALSSEQATAVARALTKDFDIVANQVSAVGRSEFLPRASNATREGQAQNRRIEIIISPKTTGLLRLMERSLNTGN